MKHISILRLLAGGLIFTTASCSLDYDPVDMYSDVTEGVQKEEDKGVVFKDKAAVEAFMIRCVTGRNIGIRICS